MVGLSPESVRAPNVPLQFRLTSRPPLGVLVPMPTLVSAVAPLTLLMLPKMIELLWATCARLRMTMFVTTAGKE